jgi:hypothetical protein
MRVAILVYYSRIRSTSSCVSRSSRHAPHATNTGVRRFCGVQRQGLSGIIYIGNDGPLRTSALASRSCNGCLRSSWRTSPVVHGIGKPVPQIETPDEPEPALTNEERKERARELLAIAFGRVIEGHPELGSERFEDHPEPASEETKCGPPTPSSSIAPATIEQPIAAPAASNGHDRVERRPRVFAPPVSRPARYRPPPRVHNSWSN